MYKKNTKILIVLILSFLLIIINFIPVVATGKNDNINNGKIDEFIKSKMKSKKIPGVSLAIVKDNKIVYLKGYGVDGKGSPITPQTPFNIGSVSKSFTGLAIMQLVDKGKIELDSPVMKYLPWFVLADREASNQITISQILSHTSGFSTFDGREILMKDDITIEQLVRNLKYTKISKSTKYTYSNINYVILGAIIQAVSGASYEQYIEKNIFEPLDMKHSYANQNKALENGLSSGYSSYFGFMLPTKMPSHDASVPAGYLSSTSEDMAHYVMAEMNNGVYKNNSIISESSMDRTHTPISINYGMGWYVEPNIIWHAGDTENFHTDVRMYKYNNSGVVMLFNSNDYITPILSNSGAYADIPNGVADILLGIEPVVQQTKSNTPLLRSLINVAGIVILLLLVIAVCRLFKWKKRLTLNKISLTRKVIILIVINVLIPLAITVILPVIFASKFETPIKVFIAWVPDFGFLVVLIPTVLFAIGITKITILISFIRSKQSNRTRNI